MAVKIGEKKERKDRVMYQEAYAIEERKTRDRNEKKGVEREGKERPNLYHEDSDREEKKIDG